MQDSKKRLWHSDKVGRYNSETDEPDKNHQAMVTIGVDGKTCNKQGGA
jgi:protocatechuate 3,4-dioxygenase beta subunit